MWDSKFIVAIAAYILVVSRPVTHPPFPPSLPPSLPPYLTDGAHGSVRIIVFHNATTLGTTVVVLQHVRVHHITHLDKEGGREGGRAGG